MKHLQLTTFPVFLLMSGCAAEVDVHQAAADGDVTVVKKKLDAGMDLHHRDELYQLTLLHDASQFGQMEVAELLISRGADLNAKDKVGATPLHYAALGGHIGIINLLVAKGAELNIKAEIKDATISLWVNASEYAQPGFLFEKTANNTLNSQYNLYFDITDQLNFRLVQFVPLLPVVVPRGSRAMKLAGLVNVFPCPRKRRDGRSIGIVVGRRKGSG